MFSSLDNYEKPTLRKKCEFYVLQLTKHIFLRVVKIIVIAVEPSMRAKQYLKSNQIHIKNNTCYLSSTYKRQLLAENSLSKNYLITITVHEQIISSKII